MSPRSALVFGLLGIALAGASVCPAGPPAPAPGDDPLPPGALARMGSFRFRNTTPINADLSPDGRLFAVVAPRNRIRLLDAATGKEVRSFATDPQGSWRPLAFSPDGKSLGVAGESGQVMYLYDVATGKKLRQFEAPDNLPRRSFFFSADGGTLVAFGDAYREKGHFFVWDVATGKLLARFESPPSMGDQAAISPDGKTLVCWQAGSPGYLGDDKQALARDQTVLGWNVTTGKESVQFRVEWDYQKNRLGCFSPDGRTLALFTGDSTIEIWDPYTGKQMRRLIGRRGLRSFLTFSPDGKTILAETSGGVVQSWDVATGRRVGLSEPLPRTVSPPYMAMLRPDGPPWKLVFSPDGRVLAWRAADHALDLSDLSAAKLLTPAGSHREAVPLVVFSADGKTVRSCSSPSTIFEWDPVTGRRLRAINCRSDSSEGVLFGNRLSSSDRKLFLGGTSTLRELATGREVCSFESRIQDATSALSPTGTMLAIAGTDDRGSVTQVWNIGSGETVRRLAVGPGKPRGVALAADGRTLAVGSHVSTEPSLLRGQIEVRLWDVVSGVEIRKVQGDTLANAEACDLMFSPDGKVLAVVGGWSSGWCKVVICDVATGVRLHDLGIAGWHDQYIRVGFAPSGRVALAFSPDGRTLAIGGDSKVILCEVATGNARREWTGHQGPVTALDFSPDGKRLVSGGADTTLLVWDVAGPRAGPHPRGHLKLEALEELWSELADRDAPRAYRAIGRLVDAPADALPFLHKQLSTAFKPGAELAELGRTIANLDHDTFQVRERAQRDLVGLGKGVEPALRKFLAGAPSTEARQRGEKVLKELAKPGWPMNEVRLRRAIEAIERADKEEARKVLTSLAEGPANALLTQEAKAALQRLTKQPTAEP
jgi:WD40 repeat protein